MPKKSRKLNRRVFKTRKQRGGSWFSGITDKVKGLFSIDKQGLEVAPTMPSIAVPRSEPLIVKAMQQQQQQQQQETPRKRRNNINNPYGPAI